VNFCSFETPAASKALKIWACPNTPAYCGTRTMRTAAERNQVLRPYGSFMEFLKDGAGCRYKLIFPLTAGKYDQIAISVRALRKMDLLVADTVSYKSPIFKETQLQKKDTYIVEYPNSLYITVNANNQTAPGQFNLLYRYIDRKGDMNGN